MPEKITRVRRQRKIKPFHGFERLLRPTTLAILIGSLVFLIAMGLIFFTYGARVYSEWREGRLLKQATELLREQKFNEATQAAEKVLELDPDSLPAFYILAEAAEKQSDSDALPTFYTLTETAEKQNRDAAIAWRAQIARLRHHDLESQLNLVSAALRFGQLDSARKALAEVAPSDRDKAAYHVVAGWLARAEGNLPEQERQFAAALEKEPHNDLYQFNLAVLRIRSSNAEESSSARDTLDRLTKTQDFRAGALRALLNDAIQWNDFPRAEKLAQDLQMSEQVRFGDYLLCLDFYRKLDEKKFNALLEKVKPLAARNPTDVALLMDWMNNNALSAEVLKWMDKLSSSLTTSPPPAIAIAEAFTNLKNWSRLKRWTRNGSWGNAEYLRLAYQAYGSKQSRQSAADAEFTTLWQSAERSASGQEDRETNLARLATKWNLTTEAEQLWLRLAKHPPTRHEALDSLFRIYRSSNDLKKLLDIARQNHNNAPNDLTAKITFARLVLLLEPNTAEGRQLAEEAYEQAPGDTACAVTYAFSLYEQGRTTEGIEVLKKLSWEQLHDPHAAAYVAVLLLDDNQADAAKEYIEATEAGHLDIEEKRLLDDARTKVSTNAPSPLPSPTPSVKPAPSPTATSKPTVTPTAPATAEQSPH
jgi:thioredoxin-like negative regulator of GroEL